MQSYDPLRDENNLGEINSFNSHNSNNDMDDEFKSDLNLDITSKETKTNKIIKNEEEPESIIKPKKKSNDSKKMSGISNKYHDEPKKSKKSAKFDDEDDYMGDEDKKIDKIQTKINHGTAVKKETRGRPKAEIREKDESLNIKNTKDTKRKRVDNDDNENMDDED